MRSAQSSVLNDDSSLYAYKAVDGDVRPESVLGLGNNVSITKAELNPWWEVFLGISVVIDSITIYNRDIVTSICTGDLGGNCSRRLKGFRLEIFNGADGANAVFTYDDPSSDDPGFIIPITTMPSGTIGDRVRISLPNKSEYGNYLMLTEVVVFSYVNPN